MFDIDVLRVIWWLLLGVLFIGFAVMDGFDFGAAVLMPFVTRNDAERRIVLNTIGPFWEGNQVWIILGAGAIFAAWPYVYAVAFSGAYFAVLLLLLTMGISRPVSFKYRSKLPGDVWRRTWDWIVFIGGLVPAILFGVLVGNLMVGLPFYFDPSLRLFYAGTFLSLLNPFALWCGLTSLMMLVMHGGLYLANKTYDPIRSRAIKYARFAACAVIVLFAGGGIWVSYFVTGYQALNGVDPMGYSNPLHKEVIPLVGAWVQNYSRYPLAMLAPLLGLLGAVFAFMTAPLGNGRVAFISSGISLAGIIATVGVSMFPFILPSSSNLSSGLLVWDSSSSQLTLTVMLFAVIIFMPIILVYTAWVYRMLRGRVSQTTVEQDKQSY